MDGKHISTDDLELYHLGRIQEPDLSAIEEHLLGCLKCVDRAEAIVHFIKKVRCGIVRGGFEGDLVAEE